MKAVGALLAERLGVKTTEAQAFSDKISVGEETRVDVEPFSEALKTAVGKFEKHEEPEAETPVVRKYLDAENLAAVDVNSLQKPDKNELFLKHWFVRNDVVETTLAESPELNTNPQVEGSIAAEVIPLGEAIETALTEVAEPDVQPQIQGSVADEDAPLQSVGQTFQSADGMNRVLDGSITREMLLSREHNAIITPEAVAAPEKKPLQTTTPLTEGQWVVVDQSLPEPLAQDGPRYAKAMSDNSFPERVEAPTGEFDFALDTTLFSSQVTPSEKQDAETLGGRLLQWGQAKDPASSAKMTPTIMPFESVLQQISPQSLPQPEATHTVSRLESLFDQIVQNVRFAQHAQSSELQIHLKPDFLGRLSIRVLSDHHGMRIEIRAENEIVRQVMQDNLPNLQQRLAEKGFVFNQFSVLADTGWTAKKEPGWSFASASPGLRADSEATAEVLLESGPLVKSGVIDYFA